MIVNRVLVFSRRGGPGGGGGERRRYNNNNSGGGGFDNFSRSDFGTKINDPPKEVSNPRFERSDRSDRSDNDWRSRDASGWHRFHVKFSSQNHVGMLCVG